MTFRFPLILILGITLGSCGEVEQPSEEGLAAIECPENNILSWQNFGDPFVRNWCTGCHSSDLATGSRQDAPKGINLDQHEDAQALAEKIYARAIGNHDMPPVGDPPEEELERLALWLACGAP